MNGGQGTGLDSLINWPQLDNKYIMYVYMCIYICMYAIIYIQLVG